jgi:hypothetical protein
MSGTSYECSPLIPSISAASRSPLVLNTTIHSSASSTAPSHQYVLRIGLGTWAHAASRISTMRRDRRPASACESVVVVT